MRSRRRTTSHAAFAAGLVAIAIAAASPAAASGSYVPPVAPPKVYTYTHTTYTPGYTFGSYGPSRSSGGTSSAGSDGYGPRASNNGGPSPLELEEQWRTDCMEGKVEACLRAADALHARGSVEWSLRYYDQACKLGAGYACDMVGLAFIDGKGRAKSLPSAQELFVKACTAKDADGCHHAGLTLGGHSGLPGVPTDLTAARAYETKACDLRLAAGCVMLARMREAGDGGPKDEAGAREAHGKACDYGYAPSCFELGQALLKGPNAAPAAAEARFLTACDHDVPAGCGEAGLLAKYGAAGVPKAPDVARKRFERGCDGKDGFSCLERGYLAMNGLGGPPDLTEAARFFERGCNDADKGSCRMLARALATGQGVPVNGTRAVTLLGTACDAKDYQACAMLGGILRAGQGVPVDAARAAQLYQRACDGDPKECLDIAEAYVQGVIVPKDVRRGIDLMQRSCDAQNDLGCAYVGLYLRDGVGGRRDPTLAARYLDLSCQRGNTDACDWLGDLYAAGLGVTRSISRAYQLAFRACEDGVPSGCDHVLARSSEITDKERLESRVAAERNCAAGIKAMCVLVSKLVGAATSR